MGVTVNILDGRLHICFDLRICVNYESSQDQCIDKTLISEKVLKEGTDSENQTYILVY